MLRVRATLLAAALLAGCDSGGYRVTVHLPSAGAVRQEISVLGSCTEIAKPGDPPASPLLQVIAEDGAVEPLGHLPAGAYGLYGRAWNADCQIFAAGCNSIRVEAGGSGTLDVVLAGIPPLGCEPGMKCIESECQPFDADSGVDAGVDSGVDAGPEPCPDPPPGASSDQIAALQILDEMRQQIGVPCPSMVAEINACAQSHADYGATNGGDAECASHGSDETPKCPGFTGESFAERMTAAGYFGASSFEIVHFYGDPAAAIANLMDGLTFRMPLIGPNTLELGYGRAEGWDVLDFGDTGPADADEIWFYPPDGATGVSPIGGSEGPPVPEPPAGCADGPCTYGTFISIMVDRDADFSVDLHELSGPAGTVEHAWMTPAESFWLASSYAIVTDPLDSRATYTVHVAGRLNDRPIDRTVRFTTR